MPPHISANKDVNDIKPVDWQTYYSEAEKMYRKQVDINNKLNDDFLRRQARYNKREQEYRRHIEELQRELRIRLGYEVDAYKKNERVIKALQNELHSNIDGIQDKIKVLKEEQEKDIVRKFSTDLNKLKSEIENSKTTKGDTTANMKDRENQLNQHLEVITNIAQRIENENRALMKKNSELKKEYQSQENDRELLLKQLVMLKKENGKIKEEIDYYNKIIEEKKEDVDEEVNIEESPLKSNLKDFDKGQNHTLLNSRQQSKRANAKGPTDSMRQSTGGLNMDPASRADDIIGGLGSYTQKPQETEEDKIKRYERIIDKLKKTLEFERKNLKGVRTQYQGEMQHKTELEDMLKECVSQVKEEIVKRNKDPKISAINNIQKKGKKVNSINDIEFTQQDRERVIELLLSQEKVLYLLYEKTFPNEENADPKIENENEHNEENDNNEENLDDEIINDDIEEDQENLE